MPGAYDLAVPTSRRARIRLLAPARLGIGMVGLVVLALMAGACGDDDVNSADTTTSAAEGTPDLAGTNWVIRSPEADGPAPVLDFGTDGSVSGSTGCNRFAGTFTQDGASLRIELGPLTRAACTSPALQGQEDRILAALPTVRGVDVEGGAITLVDADDKDLLRYDPVSSDLEGTSWRVTGVNRNGGVETSALTEKLTAEFASGGKVSGNGGCNNFNGTYVVDGSSITISDVASTMMGCEQDVMDLEQAYLAALERATTFTVSGDTLELRDDTGALQVSLRAAP